MEVLLLTIFVSMALAVLGVALFAWLGLGQTFDHSDRLALLPLDSHGPSERSGNEPIVEAAVKVTAIPGGAP